MYACGPVQRTILRPHVQVRCSASLPFSNDDPFCSIIFNFQLQKSCDQFFLIDCTFTATKAIKKALKSVYIKRDFY